MPGDVKCVEVLESTADVNKTEQSILVATEIVDEILVAASEEELGKYFSHIALCLFRIRLKMKYV